MKAQGFTKETIKNIGISDRKFPSFSIGDTIQVGIRIKEGDKERVQSFTGDVIAIKKNGASSTFKVRKIGANSVAVERTFPYYAPVIDSIKVIRKGKVRRAKLYYIRERVGKKARITEDRRKKENKATTKAEPTSPMPEATAEETVIEEVQS